MVGALLLTVPVLVAAAIAFGGAEGLTSLASGPSDAAVRDAPAQLAAHRSLESLSASLSPITAKQAARNNGGSGQPSAAGGPGGTTPATLPSGGSVSGGGAGAGLGTGTGLGGAPAANPTIPSTNGLNINSMVGGGGQPGLLGGLLHSLGLGPK